MHPTSNVPDVLSPQRSLFEGVGDYLPVLSNDVRGVPNEFLRSALFSSGRSKSDRYINNQQIASISGFTIHYSGPALDQDTLDVFETILHFVQEQPMGTTMLISRREFLRLLNKTGTGPNMDWLVTNLTYLRTTAIVIKDESKKRGRWSIKGLIDTVDEGGSIDDAPTDHLRIKVDPAIVSLFTRNNWTRISWSTRRALGRSDLAKWLHGFFSSHDYNPVVRYSIDKLRELSGSDSSNADNFKKILVRALKKLDGTATADGRQFQWQFDSKGLLNGGYLRVQQKLLR